MLVEAKDRFQDFKIWRDSLTYRLCGEGLELISILRMFVLVTEDGPTAETGLTIKSFFGIGTSITQHLLTMNFRYIDGKKIISIRENLIDWKSFTTWNKCSINKPTSFVMICCVFKIYNQVASVILFRLNLNYTHILLHSSILKVLRYKCLKLSENKPHVNQLNKFRARTT